MRGAINRGEFDPKGHSATQSGVQTFAGLLDVFDREYIAKRKADGKQLRSNSHGYYVARFRAEFASEKVAALEKDGKQTTRKLAAASWNRYYEHGRRFFSWGIAQGYATVKELFRRAELPVGVAG